MTQQTLKEKTAKGLFWGALNSGAMQILNAVIGVCLSRILSTSDYGLVGMLAIFTAVAAALQESGFTSALANLEKATDNDYNAVFWFSTLVSWCSYIVLFLCAPLIADFFHHAELIDLSRFIFATLLFSAIGTAPTAYLFKNLMVKETAILRTFAARVRCSGHHPRTEGLCLLEFGLATDALYCADESRKVSARALETVVESRFYTDSQDVFF